MRPSILRLSAVVSLVFTLISFILAAITLFTGRNTGTLENYAALRVNTSMAPKAVIEFGLNQLTGSNSMRSIEELTSRSNSWLDSLTSDVGNFLGDIEKNISNAFTRGIDSVVGDAVATAKRQLNISDWYSLHVLGTCQGDYTPNATVSNPGRRTKGCREDVRHRFNIAEVLDQQFQIGNRNVNGISDDLYSLVILLSLAFSLLGAALFSTVANVVWPGKKSLVLATLVLTTLASSIIMGASIAVTVQTSRSTSELNKRTKRIGIETSRGNPFLIIIWTLMAFTTIVSLSWQALYLLVRRDARRAEIVKYSAKRDASGQLLNSGSVGPTQREKSNKKSRL
ncbi:hypothetical protein BB8028_0002g12410 [Beauveria bassiana]|uniref:SUR7 protein n=1 Tax=Beauveria bassiana TaxID=176275 RepID=A0A2S7Y4P1_BEABA|nr:hypothetical protein BB8028_0002g12410 [Beauveria bassiana]